MINQILSLFSQIFEQYSLYTGTGIFMVMFLVTLVYMGLKDENHGNRTVLLYGSIAMIMIILFPGFYYMYVKYIDGGTYWRMWWLVPVGIGLAYVGATLVDKNRVSGFILAIFILMLGGQLVYTSRTDFVVAQNDYKIPQWVIGVCDVLEAQEDEYYNVAVPTEFLTLIRQYDCNISLPYGREQLDGDWGNRSGFFEEMNKDALDFHVLAMKSGDLRVNYIVVNNLKEYLNSPELYGFELVGTVGVYEVYHYTRVPEC